MPKRVVLDQEYINRVKAIAAMRSVSDGEDGRKKVPCLFCGFRTIDKCDDLLGHFYAFCPRCRQEAKYNAADYRHYSYIAHPEALRTLPRESVS
jgi:hypothetical protein